MDMRTPLLLLALTATPCAQADRMDCPVCAVGQAPIQNQLREIRQLIHETVDIDRTRGLELIEQVETQKNTTAQLLEELSIVRSRQAASSAVQAFMALAFLAYLATIAVCYLVKRCRKHQKEIAKAEFEMLETKLQASRSRRRAAAAARTNKQTSQ